MALIDIRKHWRVLLSALLFAVSGSLASWGSERDDHDGVMWRVALFFGIPLVLMCRCRKQYLRPLWFAASYLAWWSASLAGADLYLSIREAGVAIAGLCGALVLAASFSLLVRRMSLNELALLSVFGLLGGVVFSTTLRRVGGGLSSDLVGSTVGFEIWQVFVGGLLVSMSQLQNRPAGNDRA